MDDADKSRVVALARQLYCTSDGVEIDDNASVSEADTGAWVQAWVWVSNEDEGEDQ